GGAAPGRLTHACAAPAGRTVEEVRMGPLEGVRIVEFDAIGPVPLAAMLLADMGADIVRIVRPGGQSAYADTGGSILERGRVAVELDMKLEDGRRAALALTERAD